MALWEIRGRKLYSHRGYQSFEQYCRTHWGFDSSYASRLCCEALLAREISGDVRQSHLGALLPAVKGWKAKQGPDFSAAVRIYEETARERADFTARDLKTKVRALKQGTKRSIGVNKVRPGTTTESESEEAPPVSPTGAPDPADQVLVQMTAGASEQEEVEDFRPGQIAKHSEEATDIREPLVEALGECERELARLVKRLRHRMKVSHDDLMSLRTAYQHLQCGFSMVDSTHEPAVRIEDLPDLPANDQLVISPKKGQSPKGKSKGQAKRKGKRGA